MSIEGFKLPPTDSLYKFYAISGTLIVLFSIYFSWIVTNKRSDALFDIEKRVSIQGAEVAALKNEVKLIESIVLYSKTKEGMKIYPRRDVDKLLMDFTTKHKEIEMKAAETKTFMENSKRVNKETVIYLFFTLLTCLFGFLISYYGYHNWYYKVQQYQDIMLKCSVSPEKDQN